MSRSGGSATIRRFATRLEQQHATLAPIVPALPVNARLALEKPPCIDKNCVSFSQMAKPGGAASMPSPRFEKMNADATPMASALPLCKGWGKLAAVFVRTGCPRAP